MISIIVPIYNVEKYLRKCIDSIIGQTYKDIQIILVNDGSPDGCPQICDEYAEKDSRIIVIHQVNSGVSVARNAGLKVATGEYIGFVDADDFVALDMYENMVKVLERDDTDLVICGYDYVDEHGNVLRAYQEKDSEIISQKECFKRYFDMPPSIRLVIWNKLFKRELFNDISFPQDIKGAEDAQVLREYVKIIRSAVILHTPYCKNCERMGSATRGGLKADAIIPALDIYMETRKHVNILYPDIQNHAQAYYMDACLLNCNVHCKEHTREQKEVISEMRRRIRNEFPKAFWNHEIYWKTRIYYFLFAIGLKG